MKRSVEALAVAYAGMLSQFELEPLNERTPDVSNYYTYLNEMLRKWMMEQPGIQSMYVLNKDGSGRPYYILGPEKDYNRNGRIDGRRESRVPLGMRYYARLPELDHAFAGLTSTQSKPTDDDRGLSLSTFAPVRRDDGSVAAVIAVGLDGKKVNAQMGMERLKGYGLLLIPYLVILGTYWLYLRTRMEKLILSSKQRELLRHEERYKTLSDSNVEGMVIHRNGVILEVNRALCAMFGYTAGEMIGSTIFPLILPEDYPIIESKMKANVQEVYRLRGRRHNGEVMDLEVHVNICLFNGETARAVALRDITDRRRQEETIYRLAYYDELTGLPNKKRFLRSLNRWLSAAGEGRAAVFFMDLDKFKPINDSLGHSAGDAALKACTERLLKELPKGGRLARWGGDEFIVLLPDVLGRREAGELAARFVRALERPIYCKDIPVKVGISVGISLYPEDGTDEETLIRKADAAMYIGKRTGGGSVRFYDSSLQEKAEQRVRLEQELRLALAQGQFELHYQPQVLMETGEITAAEALIRWKHPAKGYIPPMEFIPIAEETGLILEIGDWVLRQACRDMSQMQREGLSSLRIAVNLSALQFGKEDLADTVRSVLQETKLEPRLLELEITETMMMDPVHALGVLVQLKNLGVRISIDDFGTGFSSLHYLNRFPIDKLKIDRSFVTDLNGGEAPITTAIVSLARTLRLETIAEGVETPTQAEHLQKLGCTLAQGYLYYKPMTKEQLFQLLHSRLAG
ncbi:bifunctional diguanylate cyclase/phosphodiesterase [Gorillibacterium sp. sgz5001074]|uniref:bifunctional diguanylate cyclase/phosphodiesterase n=1 Tax=Gorillibacterium sp. sgz5001074 TaxID=3446695 RepID=UPI003F679A42